MNGATTADIWPLITNAGPSGLLSICVAMIMFGWLVPVKLYRDRMSDKDRIIAALQADNDTLRANNETLRGIGSATEKVLDATTSTVSGSGRDDHRAKR